MIKDRVIELLESHGFVTISHKSSSRQIFFKDNIAVIVVERNEKKEKRK